MQVKSEIDYGLSGVLANECFFGAAICMKDGELLSCHMPESYDCEMLKETVYTLINAFPTIKHLGLNVESTDFTFDHLRLMVKEQAETFTIMLVDPNLQDNVVNNAIRVTEAKLDDILQNLEVADAEHSTQLEQAVSDDEKHALKAELEETSVLIFGEETTFGQNLQTLLDDEDVLFFKDRSSQ